MAGTARPFPLLESRALGSWGHHWARGRRGGEEPDALRDAPMGAWNDLG